MLNIQMEVKDLAEARKLIGYSVGATSEIEDLMKEALEGLWKLSPLGDGRTNTTWARLRKLSFMLDVPQDNYTYSPKDTV